MSGLRLVLFGVNSDSGLALGPRPPLAFFLGGALADLLHRQPPPDEARAATHAEEEPNRELELVP